MKILQTNLQFKNALAIRKSTKRIFIHHAAASNCSIETIHSWHLGNGWSGIGYHFFIRKNGDVYAGRPINTVGAHCTNQNSDSIGICFEGNFQEENMNAKQIQAGQELLSYLYKLYGLTSANVKGHRDLMATSCPGKNFPFATIVKGVQSTNVTTEKTNTENKSTVNVYTVVKGDTLSSIGKKTLVDWKNIAKYNNLKSPYKLYIGQKLKLTANANVSFVGYNVKITAKSGLNMRKGAGESFGKIITIPKNKKVFISKVENGWGYTCHDGKYGWIYLMYTKKC